MNMQYVAILSAAIPFMLTGCAPALTPPKPVAASAAALNWVRYTDSAEGAFSMDVPVGWQVQGGMYRFGYFDVRWMMDIRSLDGKVIIRIDDVDVPPYALPAPNTGRPGQPYFKPQQFQMVVDNYREAQPWRKPTPSIASRASASRSLPVSPPGLHPCPLRGLHFPPIAPHRLRSLTIAPLPTGRASPPSLPVPICTPAHDSGRSIP